MKNENESDLGNYSSFSKWDKIGFILLIFGGGAFLYDVSPTIGRVFVLDFNNLNQPSLFPDYISMMLILISGLGTALTLMALRNQEGCF